MKGTTLYVLTSNLPIAVILGTRSLCTVLSIMLLNRISKPGISVKTDKRESIMALTKTTAISRPIKKCMKARATKPAIVVREDEEISGMAFERASIQASLGAFVTCSAR